MSAEPARVRLDDQIRMSDKDWRKLQAEADGHASTYSRSSSDSTIIVLVCSIAILWYLTTWLIALAVLSGVGLWLAWRSCRYFYTRDGYACGYEAGFEAASMKHFNVSIEDVLEDSAVGREMEADELLIKALARHPRHPGRTEQAEANPSPPALTPANAKVAPYEYRRTAGSDHDEPGAGRP